MREAGGCHGVSRCGPGSSSSRLDLLNLVSLPEETRPRLGSRPFPIMMISSTVRVDNRSPAECHVVTVAHSADSEATDLT
jgi:hypothetical protein